MVNMKRRKLKNGQRVLESKTSIKMTIDTKCPKKWIFVDMETGDLWVHWSRFPSKERPHYTFYRADKDAIRALDNIMTEIKVQELGMKECVS